MSTRTDTTTLPTATREIHLASRPHGRPVPENFRLPRRRCPSSRTARCWSATSTCPSTPTCAAG